MSTKTQTRGRFLAGLTGIAGGATVAGANAAPHPSAAARLDMRYGRTASPRISVSHPKNWFVTTHLTDVLDPIEGQEHGETYFTLMHRNLAALRKALGCR